MFKLYRYCFYQFYKSAIRTEKQWHSKIRTPAFVANITLTIFFTIFILSIIILFPTDADWISFIPSISGIVLFALNYLLIIKTNQYLIDEKEFDTSVNKRNRKILFLILIISTVIFIVLSFVFSESKRNEKMFFNSKKINLNMNIIEVINLLQYPDYSYLNDNKTDSVYYYEFDYNEVKGVEIYFSSDAKKVKRVNYLE